MILCIQKSQYWFWIQMQSTPHPCKTVYTFWIMQTSPSPHLKIIFQIRRKNTDIVHIFSRTICRPWRFIFRRAVILHLSRPVRQPGHAHEAGSRRLEIYAKIIDGLYIALFWILKARYKQFSNPTKWTDIPRLWLGYRGDTKLASEFVAKREIASITQPFC